MGSCHQTSCRICSLSTEWPNLENLPYFTSTRIPVNFDVYQPFYSIFFIISNKLLSLVLFYFYFLELPFFFFFFFGPLHFLWKIEIILLLDKLLSMRDYYHSFRRAGIPLDDSLLPYIILLPLSLT